MMDTIQQLHHRCPDRIQVDNGSEFISKAIDKWAYENQVVLDFSRLDKQWTIHLLSLLTVASGTNV